MRKPSLVIVAAALFFPLTTGAANAAVITFDGLGTNVDDPVVVDGFEFDYIDRDGWIIGQPPFVTNTLGNGTDFISCRDTVDADCAIVMTVDGGGIFSLSAFDGADALVNVGGRTILVTGQLSGGGIVVDSFVTVANTFATFALSGAFVGLESVEFRGFGAGDDGFALDNIVVDGITVAEPTTVTLLGAGLLGVALLLRRRRPA